MNLFSALLCFKLIFGSIFASEGVSVGQQCYRKCIIKYGDNVFRMSLKYKVPIDSIQVWNHLDSSLRIIVGQVLVIKSVPLVHGATSGSIGLSASIDERSVAKRAPAVSVEKVRSSLGSKGNYKDTLSIYAFDTTRVNQQDSTALYGTKTYLPTLSHPIAEKPDGLVQYLTQIFSRSGWAIQVVMVLNLFFIVSIVTLVIIIFIRRVREGREKNRINRYVSDYRDLIADWIFSENEKLPEWFTKSIKDRLNRIIFSRELISLHNNLVGESAERARQLYKLVQLDQDAISNIDSHWWHLKAKGFREISQMGIAVRNNEIRKYLNHPNDVLRIEAQVAWILLNPHDPLAFYDNPSIRLTVWGQLNSHLALKKIDVIPDLSKWIREGEGDVARFSIHLAGIFKLYEQIDAIISRLEDRDPTIRFESIKALGNIAQPSAAWALQKRYSEELRVVRHDILNALIAINDPINRDFFSWVLHEESDSLLRIRAARGLYRIRTDGEDPFASLWESADYTLKEIINHAKDIRIN